MFLNLSWGTQSQICSEEGRKGGTRESQEETQKQREETSREKATHLPEKGVSEKHARTDKSDTQTDKYTEAGREAGTYQSHSQHKKGHLANIYLMDSDEEVIVDFVKDHKELYEKTKDCLWEKFANIGKLSFKVRKT